MCNLHFALGQLDTPEPAQLQPPILITWTGWFLFSFGSFVCGFWDMG